MFNPLRLQDNLATRSVTIVIQLVPGEVRRTRQMLLSLGVAGAAPVFRSGTFAELEELITDAWAEYGSRPIPSASSPTQIAIAEEEEAEEPEMTLKAQFIASGEVLDLGTEPQTEVSSGSPAPAAPAAATPPRPEVTRKQSILDLF